MAMPGFSKTIPFPILGVVVIVAGTFLQRLFDRTREDHGPLCRMKRVAQNDFFRTSQNL
jgi:hypothetical protein